MPDETGRTGGIAGRPAAAPELPEFADKARDLQALRDAVVEAAGVGGGLWLSYLFVFFYLAIAAGGVSHADLFFENPVKLPFLNVDLPLLGFFVLGPLLFLIVHAYTLLHFTFLAGKVIAFDAELEQQIGNDDAEANRKLRRQLPSNIFVQFLAGPPETRNGLMGLLLRGIAWISLVFGPVLLLVLFQLQFLPFHSEGIAWEQRLVVVADLALLWFLWPAVARSADTVRARGRLLRGRVWIFLVGLASLLLVFTVATFPGEWLDESRSLTLIGWMHTWLVRGEVNEVTGRPTSWWSNRLVLPGIDILDHANVDAGKNVGVSPATFSLRGRHLEGAVLIAAHLGKADFTGAYLIGAKLYGADLREAKFECADPGSKGAEKQCTRLQGANLEGAQLQSASLSGAQLQGADLWAAQLQDANLQGAGLQGADLSEAQLQGANLGIAQMQGTSLNYAQLQGASLAPVALEGGGLGYAHLEGAALRGAQLQGADFAGAQLQDTSLEHVFVWKADMQGADTKGARLTKPETAPKFYGLGYSPQNCSQGQPCPWTGETFAKLKRIVETAIPPGSQREAVLARIARLDPGAGKKFAWRPDAWTRLTQSSPSPRDYAKALADRVRQIGCTAAGAPYVIRGLLGSKFDFGQRFTADPMRAVAVARAFLDEARCPGARGLTEREKTALREIRDRAAPAKP